MNQPFEYPEERMQKELLNPVQHNYQDAIVESAEGKELQNAFAIFYLIRHGLRIAKLRVSAEKHLLWRNSGTLILSDIEELLA